MPCLDTVWRCTCAKHRRHPFLYRNAFALTFPLLSPLTPSLEQILDKLKSLGYNGIEMPIAFAMKYGLREFDALMKAKDMQLVAQVS